MKFVALLLLAYWPSLDAASLRSKMRRAKMTFVEEQMSMQMKMMMPEKATLDHIEASILNMARSKTSKQDTSGSNLTAFLDQIQDLLDTTMKKNILQRQNQTQNDLDEAYANMTTCTHPNDTDLVESLKQLDETHLQCRQEQDRMWSDYNTTCIVARKIFEDEKEAVCNAYEQAKVFPPPVTTCAMGAGTPVPTIGHYLIDMEKFFTAAYDALAAKKHACESIGDFPNDELCKQKICEYHDKRIGCDKTQEAFEKPACDGHKQYQCSGYSDCYAQKKDIYDNVNTLAKENEKAAKAEWRAVLRIECLLQALTVPEGEIEEAISACKAKTHSTKPVELTYRTEVPAERACTEVYLQPGMAAFSSTWYAGLPTATPAASCASACCMAESFNPTYPSDVACPYVPGATTTLTTTTTTKLVITTTTKAAAAAAAATKVATFGGFGGFPR
ncbi:unnamed protein product [Effrenium voratum]|uniref:Uncharacterized protein n=1 Tax=Effrenium voratum TaxID=2562239 RepID=A0AA36HS44_9DINO|nr:unnamed protein product [Effrenium voratum]CAJ1433064.1 unnamed protein product [Effrenium voratum]